MNNQKLLKDALGWGFLLWLVGYALGIILFIVAPSYLIGWIITPIMTAVSIWVLWKKVHAGALGYFFLVGLIWLGIAVVGDYFLLVKAFNPADGYYKLDVYIYYSLTIMLPLIVGWLRRSRQ